MMEETLVMVNIHQFISVCAIHINFKCSDSFYSSYGMLANIYFMFGHTNQSAPGASRIG